jgi:hypothetical protein
MAVTYSLVPIDDERLRLEAKVEVHNQNQKLIASAVFASSQLVVHPCRVAADLIFHAAPKPATLRNIFYVVLRCFAPTQLPHDRNLNGQ